MILSLALLLPFSSSNARDLGIYGKIYKIEEQDMLIVIKDKLRSMQENGQMANLNKEYANQLLADIDRPRTDFVPQRAVNMRKYYFDPTIKLPYDIKDHQGIIIYEKNQSLSPLKFVSLQQKLVFIDGDDEEQIKWLQDNWPDNNALLGIKIILIKGKPISFSKIIKSQVYFDSNGKIVRKLDIKNFPAIVTQEGYRLMVEEVVL